MFKVLDVQVAKELAFAETYSPASIVHAEAAAAERPSSLLRHVDVLLRDYVHENFRVQRTSERL